MKFSNQTHFFFLFFFDAASVRYYANYYTEF